MTIGELRRMIRFLPDGMNVFVIEESAISGFVYRHAAVSESGVIEFTHPEPGLKDGFLIAAYDDAAKEDPELN